MIKYKNMIYDFIKNNLLFLHRYSLYSTHIKIELTSFQLTKFSPQDTIHLF